MKLRNSLILVIILIGAFTASIFSQDKGGQSVFQTKVDGVGTNAATFLEIGVGARAIGLGGAYAAVANDATALYWNPAGIVWINEPQVEVMHNNWFMDASHDFAGGVVPLPSLNGAIGLSFITIGFGDQPVRTVDRPEGTGELYDARDFAVGLTYAMALTDRFSFGMTAKYIQQRIWHESGDAFALDLGIFYNTMVDGLRLGFSMSNFGTTISMKGRDLDNIVDPDPNVQNYDRVPVQYKTESAPLPLLFRVGISYEAGFGKFGSALATMDLNHPSNSNESVDLGLEYGFGGMFFLRAGYQSIFDTNSEAGLSLGGGIDWFNASMGFGVRVDYAWTDWGILTNAQRVSVGVVF